MNRREWLRDIGLLAQRVIFGWLMFAGHGLGKMQAIGTERAAKFADPFGLGPELSQFLAGSAETIGATLVILGLCTRFSALSVAFTMAVAAFWAHAADPVFAERVIIDGHRIATGSKEMALMYLFGFLTLALSGPGRLSLDAQIKWRPAFWRRLMGEAQPDAEPKLAA